MIFSRIAKTVFKPSAVLAALLFLIPSQAFAVGYDNSTIGGRSTLTGNAWSGVADDGSAIYYNPAGMINPHRKTQWDIEVGSTFTASKFYYQSGSANSSSTDNFVLPGLFITKKINDDWTVGFGAYTPFAGGGVSYENFLGSGHEMSAAAGYTAFTPAVGYKINNQWSIGMGVSGYYGIFKTKAFDTGSGQMVEMNYKGFGGFGAHASTMFRPNDVWSIGLTLRSPVYTEIDGKVKTAGTQVDSKMKADFPWSADLGIGYQKDRLKLGTSFVWMAYGQMDQIKFKTAGVETSQATGFKDGYRISLGGEYQLLERLYVIAGLRHVSGMQKDEYLSPATDDVPLLATSIALRFGVTKATDLIVGYYHTEGFEKEVGTQKFDQDYETLHLVLRAQF